MADDAPPAPSSSAAWHSLLAEHDRAVRTAEQQDEVAHAVEVLEQRLTRANAVIHALEESVLLRDQILREQQVMISDLQAAQSGLPRPRRLTSVRRVGRGLRRRAARLVGRAA